MKVVENEENNQIADIALGVRATAACMPKRRHCENSGRNSGKTRFVWVQNLTGALLPRA